MTTDRAVHTVVAAVLALACVTPAAAQSPLTLADALRRAKAQNPDVQAAAITEREAAERVTQARAGRLPRVDAAESWQRGNNPAFVFSALLAQRQITAASFGLDALNHPAAADQFRAAVSVEQSLFDGATSANIRAASIERDIATTSRDLISQDLTAAVTEAFGRVLAAVAAVRSASSAVEATRADRERAGNRRDAGRATDADVLQLDVYLARTLEREIQAHADERIARARLNQLIGEPLSLMFALDATPPAIAVDITRPADLEDHAVRSRPDVRLARQREELTGAAVEAARAAFLPQVAAQGVWEWNGNVWNSRSSSWGFGAVVRITVFDGLANRSRLAEARQHAARRAVEASKAETLVRLDVKEAIARIEAARASEAVSRAAADSARASQRIIRDRYENGLADVALLLRAADAVQQAEAQQTAAAVNQLVAAANLQRAIGQS